jgi:hypothetical protein
MPEGRYLSGQFCDELRRKADQNRVNAHFRRSSDGKRFPKDLPETDLFQAIKFLKERTFYKVSRTGRPIFDYDYLAVRVISDYVLSAIYGSQPDKLRDLATILELCGGAPLRPDAKYVPWVYYSAYGALKNLDNGRVPTKRQVIEDAIEQCATHEIFLSPLRREVFALGNWGPMAAKIEDLTKHRSPRNWAHIFRVLDLRELPP